MNELIVSYYGSAEFKGLRSSTSRVYRNILERFREEHGDKDAGPTSRFTGIVTCSARAKGSPADFHCPS
jgi:hypothetical protein